MECLDRIIVDDTNDCKTLGGFYKSKDILIKYHYINYRNNRNFYKSKDIFIKVK